MTTVILPMALPSLAFVLTISQYSLRASQIKRQRPISKISTESDNYVFIIFFFFPIPVCAITASGVPGGTFVSMNRFSTLCG
jgi:hypothetical protein